MRRSGFFWQTLLADLALILFIVSASTLDSSHAQEPASDPDQALAVWREGRDAQPFSQWLAAQQGDTRARVVITVEHPRDEPSAGWRKARQLLAQAGDKRLDARVVLQPGDRLQTLVTLQYDRGPDTSGH